MSLSMLRLHNCQSGLAARFASCLPPFGLLLDLRKTHTQPALVDLVSSAPKTQFEQRAWRVCRSEIKEEARGRGTFAEADTPWPLRVKKNTASQTTQQRLILTARKTGIKTVAVYSAGDKDARRIELANEAVYISPSPTSNSYLHNAGKIWIYS